MKGLRHAVPAWLFAAVLLAGCEWMPDGTSPSTSAAFETAKSGKDRELSPDATASELAELVTGNTEFGLDLYQAIRGNEGNLFYSPYSMSLALAMTWAGARGETETQMAGALHFTLPQDRLHVAFNALDLELESRAEPPADGEGEGFKLTIANSIWGQVDYEFLTDFLDTLAVNYGAWLRLLDFIAEPDPSRIVINGWVSEKTEGKIEDLIPPGGVTSDTRLVLTNAIYFKAAWASPFEEEDTSDGVFHTIGGGAITVPMMRQEEPFGYAAGTGWVAVELPYEGWQLSMVIIMPDAGGLEAFESSLDAATLEAILSALAGTNLDLTMPKFSFEKPLGMKQVLDGMGMVDAFKPYVADFSGMDGTRNLFVSDVLHKAFVSVNEEGTEAAAATAVVMGTTSVPPPPVPVTVDRPFVFLIRDIPTGAVLFMGRVVDPAGQG